MSPWRAPASNSCRTSERKSSETSFLRLQKMMAFFSPASSASDQLPQPGPLLVVLRPRLDETLRDRLHRARRRRHLDAHRRLQELLGELGDLGRHGRREEKGLPSERDQPADALDVGDEAHVEHAVGLVDHQDLDAGQQQLAAFEVVEQPARRCDQDVGPALELAILFVEGDAADQERDVEPVVLAVFGEVLLHLRGEFARRLQDQRARHPRPGTALFEEREHRQHEGRRLARAGLGDAEHVLALQRMRDRARLDRRGGRVSRVGNGRQHLGGKPQVGELRGVFNSLLVG